MAERIVSERVVSRKVIGSANPIAKKFRSLKSSFGGVCIAPIMIIIAFVLLYAGEKQKESSKVVESLSLETASEVTADSDMHKMQGTPTVTTPADAPELGDTLYYSYKEQEYKTVEETEYETVTSIENGEEVESEIERVKEVDKWVDSKTGSSWAEFKLGNYTVKPSGAKLEIDLSSKEYRYDEFEMIYYELTTGVSSTPEIGDYRLVVEYLAVDTELLVVGEISGTTVSGGDPFIITTKSDSELISSLKTEESITYWAMKIGSWILLTLGFLMILGPILSLLDFIPIAGQAANCVASIAAAIISAVIVLMATLIIKFWYVFLIVGGLVVVGLVVLLVVLIAKKGGGKKEEAKEPEAEAK